MAVNLWTMQKVQKVLDESNGNYESTAARKSHSDCSEKKITPKCVGEIQAVIDNDSSKLIMSTVRDMGVSEFLIRQVSEMETFSKELTCRKTNQSTFILKWAYIILQSHNMLWVFSLLFIILLYCYLFSVIFV